MARHDTKAVANYFLEKAKRAGIPMSPMKLQKIVYFAHGWCLAITGQALIDETVEAWQWGPVISSLYHEFKEFGSGPIGRLAQRTAVNGLNLALETPRLDKVDPLVRQVLDRVWDVYSKYTPAQLSSMTHQKGSPWEVVWTPMADSPVKGTDIPDHQIQEYFRQAATKKTA